MNFLLFITIVLVLASGIILGLTLISEKGKILYSASEYLKEHNPTLGKPLLTCYTCMASIWTFLTQLFLWVLFSEEFEMISVSDYLLVMFSLLYQEYIIILYVFQFTFKMMFIYFCSSLSVTFIVNYLLHKLNFYR